MMTPTFDIERARFNMIEQQIRPWEVLDQSVLDLLAVVRREEFVPPAYRALAFADTELPLVVDGRPTGETMLAPRVEARVLQELGVRNDDLALEIGAGSGYMAALLAQRARHVTTVEILPELAAMATANLQRADIGNVKVVAGDGARGYPLGHQVDVIVVSGGLPFVPDTLLAQLKPGGRLVAFVGTDPVMQAQLVTRTGPTSFKALALFETRVQPLRNAAQRPSFKF